VSAFVLRYFDGTAWQSNWDSASQGNALPTAVEVTIELAGGSGADVRRTSHVLLIPCGQGAAGATSSGGTQ